MNDRRIILVTRSTRLDELLARFVTAAQARFYLEHQGADFDDYEREAACYQGALRAVRAQLSPLARIQLVDRGFLPNFTFAPEDLVVTLGQDGLVANTLKYLNGQPVVGVNPDPERWEGRLLPFQTADLGKVMPEVLRGRRPTKLVTMAKATLNDGQTLYAVNDLFIGPKSHTSARYRLRLGRVEEQQSSSGVIISTGLGSTGWLKSLLTGAAAISQAAGSLGCLVAPKGGSGREPESRPGLSAQEFSWDADYLCYTVREPFPTRQTGASLVFGKVTANCPLVVESLMAENGVIFSDGIEKDYLEFNSGRRAVIGLAERHGTLVV